MKKASKLLWVLLALSMVLVFGCGGEDSGDTDPEDSPWEVVYIALDETTSVNKAVDAIHFHVNKGTVEIQKVFINTSKSTTGAKYILDFTQNQGTAPNIYWGDTPGYWYFKDGDVEAFNAQVKEGGTPNGRLVVTNDDGSWKYHGGFASGAAYANNATHWGFIINKDTADLSNDNEETPPPRVVLFTGDPATEVGTIRFSAMIK